MDIAELKSKKIAELTEIAKALNIPGVGDMRKQELIFKILETSSKHDGKAEENGIDFSKGVLEVLPDGYGFLR
ncbi:MAG TPA: Rho termination factor N-terminal domain-containing protein, partial [Candidatus Kapabacteria bacterium]|nr:Rho termination factor N-terminal domain-containing protein [Candidatus Kapabacteria bacterium]